ncbi:MAG: endolytic transglycosylase MltG [Rikenellaceae bacterium]|jgi:UPF0755 protein|nr:endolytic transglycosylase MltG [Rikenellaceae bacterium]
MKKSVRRPLLAAVVIIAALCVAAGVFWMRQNARAVAVPGSLYVPTGATYQTLLDSLGADGHRLVDVGTFRKAARLAGLEKSVRPGRYLLKEGMSYRAVARMLRNGLQTPVRLTFNNIRTVDRLAGSLARQIEADSVELLRLFSDPKFTAEYGFTPETFICMFIPNTYEVYWNTMPEALCGRMKKEYGAFWNAERLGKAATIPLTPLEVSILASIVYEETKMSDEMPKVAGVYINRLRIKMPLQADPTVKFAVGNPTIKRVLNRHLEVDSPYNTYRRQGLPPGPICMPSIRALDAVLNYAHHDYLYFCAASDFSGYHRFAKTLAEHSRNAAEYAAALNRAGIRR